MSNLTAKQRAQLPLSDFGQPETLALFMREVAPALG